MTKNKLFILLIICLVLVTVLTACQATPTPPKPTGTTPTGTTPTATKPPPTTAAGPSEIVIGTVVAKTGMAASFGQGAFGLTAAVEDINKAGGIFVKEYNRRIPVRHVVLDSQSDTSKVGTLAQQLILNDKVTALVTGPQWPQDIAAAANVAEKNKTPFVAYAGPFEPNNGLREASGKWKYTWESGFAIGAPTPPGDFREKLPGYTMMDLWMAYLGPISAQTSKTMAAFASDDPDGRGWYTAFTPALKGAGFNMVGTDKELGIAPMDTNDFSPMIKQWIDAKAEILIGNSPAPWFGTMWRQATSMGFKPKIVIAERAGMMYDDIMSLPGNLANGIVALIEWTPAITGANGIGDTTPKSLDERWRQFSKGQPFQQLVGCGYSQAQVLFAAIEKAGTLDKDKINEAIGQTDMMTIRHRVKYDVNQFNRMPIVFGQWQKAPDPVKWKQFVIYSQHSFYPVEAQPVFPIPYQ